MNIVEARQRIAQRRYIGGSRVRTNDYYALGGGLNLVSPPLEIGSGELIGGINYEPYYVGGYRRVDGFERLDGRLKPSAAHYTAIDFTAGVVADYPAAGELVTGGTSGATGTTLTLTRRNRHPDSEDLAAWSDNSGITVDDDSLDAPDGLTTGDRLVESAANEEHRARQDFALEAGTFCVSVYLQAGERTVAAFRVKRESDLIDLVDSYIDLTSGVATMRGAATAEVTVTPTPAGDWLRVSAIFTLAASDTARVSVFSLLALGGPATSYKYLGDGVSGLGVWGIQLESEKLRDYTRSEGGESATLILGRVTGVFVDTEDLEAGPTFGVENGPPHDHTAPDDEHWDYVVLAHDDARAQIQKPSGAGFLRGVIQYGALAYCFRNNAGQSIGQFFKSSPTGWQLVPLGRKLRFDGGVVEVLEGQVLVGNTSGATATVKRVGLRDGFWGGSPAAKGYFIFTAVTGLFQNNETLRVGSTDVAVADGADFAQALQPGGKYEFRIVNFYGHTKGIRLYGVSGVDYAFEYDNDDGVFVQIETGMVEDKPTYLANHQNQLWLSFSGGSLQKSSVGSPREWRVVTGAAELGVGREITGLLEEVGDQLFVFTRDQIKYVIGSSNADYQLKNFATETGGFAHTLQRIGQGIILDDRGFTSLATTDRFGNYVANSFSAKVQTLINELKLTASASVISRRLNLYRCFFSDGRFLSIGVSGTKITGITLCFMPITVNVATSSEDNQGREVILFGGTDGFVYQMDPDLPALSFDGVQIEAAMRTSFYNNHDPSHVHHYRRAQIDLQLTTPAEFRMSVDYSFAGPISQNEPSRFIAVDGGGGFWDVSLWDTFKWDLGPNPTAVLKLEGSGTNIGFLVYSKSAKQGSDVFSGISLSHSQRRINRGAEA